LGYQCDVNKVLDGLIVQRENVLRLMYWFSQSTMRYDDGEEGRKLEKSTGSAGRALCATCGIGAN